MGDGQVGDRGRGIRNGCIRVEEGGGGEGEKYYDVDDMRKRGKG